MAKLEDDDYLLVNRSNATYKVLGSEFKESVTPPAAVIKPQIIAPANNAGKPVTPVTDEITNIGSFGGTQLFFKSNKELSFFQPLDFIEQSSGHTPTSTEITNVNGNQLTCADSTDLQNFRAGDPIYQDSIPGSALTVSVVDFVIGNIFLTSGDGTNKATMNAVVSQNYFNSNVNDANKNGNRGVYIYDKNNHYMTFRYFNATVGQKIQLVGGNGSINALGSDLTINVTGDIEEDGSDIVFVSAGTQTKNQIPKDMVEVTTTSTAGSFTIKTSFPGGLMLHYWSNGAVIPTAKFGSASGNIIEISESDGTWQANGGRFVIGPKTTAATGTISSIDTAGNTISLLDYVEEFPKRWITKQGKTVSGDSRLQGSAPNPDGVSFVGSTFASSDSSLTAASADWQVAVSTDTSYSSPVTQVSNHPDMTPQPTWTSGRIDQNTEYRARTRYKSTTGEVSAWSDDVQFKTSISQAVNSLPGDVWSAANTAPTLSYRTASSRIALLACADKVLAVGSDGQLYHSPNANGNFAQANPSVSFSSVPISASGVYGGVPGLFVDQDGYISAYNATGGVVAQNFLIAPGVKTRVVTVNATATKCAALSQDGQIYTSPAAAQIGADDWYALPVMPGGFTRLSYGNTYNWAGANGSPHMFGVKADGTVWECSRQNSNPDTFSAWSDTGLTGIGEFISCFSQYPHYAMSKDGGTIYVGGNKGSSPAQFTAPAGTKWKQIGANYTSGIFLTESGEVYVHDKRGNIDNWSPTISSASDGMSLTQINLPNPVDSLSANQTSASGYSLGFIIPKD